MTLRFSGEYLVAAIAVMLAGTGAGQDTKSPWHTILTDAVKEARNENKPIFAVLY